MDPGSHTVRKASVYVSRSADACTYMSDHVMYVYIYIYCVSIHTDIISYYIILYCIILYSWQYMPTPDNLARPKSQNEHWKLPQKSWFCILKYLDGWTSSSLCYFDVHQNARVGGIHFLCQSGLDFKKSYPLVNIQKTMETHHVQWENPL